MWKFSSTAAATFRQAVALIFDHVVSAEALPVGKYGSGSYISRTSSVPGDISRSINRLEYVISVNIAYVSLSLMFWYFIIGMYY